MGNRERRGGQTDTLCRAPLARSSTAGTYVAKTTPEAFEHQIGESDHGNEVCGVVRHFPSLLFAWDCLPPPPPHRLRVRLQRNDDSIRFKSLPWFGLVD